MDLAAGTAARATEIGGLDTVAFVGRQVGVKSLVLLA